MHISDYKIIVVLFHPRQGGNHLANIISTSALVANRVATTNYKQELEKYYDSDQKNAHVYTISNVGVNDIEALKIYINDSVKPVIICGHISEFYYVYTFIKQLGPIGIINFENFNLNSFVLERTNFESSSEPELIDLIEWAYRTDVVQKIFEIGHQDTYTTSANNIFCSDPSEFFSSISYDLGLDLDIEYCLTLHKKWFKKISQRTHQ
jgi:hypothetical protein